MTSRKKMRKNQRERAEREDAHRLYRTAEPVNTLKSKRNPLIALAIFIIGVVALSLWRVYR